MRTYIKKTYVVAKIYSISPTHVLARLKNGWRGIIHISEMSDYLVKDINNIFKKNDEVVVQIINVDPKKKFLKLSFKNANPHFLKNPFSFKIAKTKNDFKNLFENTMKDL